VLIVEDEPINLEILQTHLHQLGYQTHSASCIEAAQQLLVQECFDVIISDVHLPDGNSLELLDWIKNHPKQGISSTAIIIQTADENTELAEQLKNTGAGDILIKPYNLDQLKDSLTHALSGSADANSNVQAEQP
jgi:two-component system response regulator PilR (NtrC family)